MPPLLPSDSATQLQLYIKTHHSPLIEVADSGERKAVFSVGEQVQAVVKGDLGNGRFAVLVKEQLLDLNLPRNTQEGQLLQFKVLAAQPKLLFALQAESAPPLVGRPSTDESGKVTLSAASTLLDTLAPAAEATARPALADALQPVAAEKAPLTSRTPPDTGQISANLQQGLSKSGLFYESHQAEWVTGARTLGELKQEPQALLPQSQPQSVLAGEPPSGDRPQPPLSEPTRLIVQQQLQVLDHAVIPWQGQAWPGQPVQMLFEQLQRDDKGAEAATPAPAVWQTRLQLTLPRLGSFSALIRLRDGAFDLQLTTDTEQGLQRLRAELGTLQGHFADAGLHLGSIATGTAVAADGVKS